MRSVIVLAVSGVAFAATFEARSAGLRGLTQDVVTTVTMPNPGGGGPERDRFGHVIHFPLNWNQAARSLHSLAQDGGHWEVPGATKYVRVTSHLARERGGAPAATFCGVYVQDLGAMGLSTPHRFIAAEDIVYGNDVAADDTSYALVKFDGLWKRYCTGPAGPTVW